MSSCLILTGLVVSSSFYTCGDSPREVKWLVTQLLGRATRLESLSSVPRSMVLLPPPHVTAVGSECLCAFFS